jgi:hypothetical protein
MLQSLRLQINEGKVEHYWFVSEAWMSKNLDVRPRDAPDKQECLIISEFRRDNKNKTIFHVFNRKDKKIVWGKRKFLNGGPKEQYQSRYNFFLEDCSEEMFLEAKKKRTLDIIKKEGMIKKMTEAMRQHLKDDSISEKSVRKTVEKMVKEGKILLSPRK